MYCRYESGVHPREPQAEILRTTSDYVFSLDEHVKYLTKVNISNQKLVNVCETGRSIEVRLSEHQHNFFDSVEVSRLTGVTKLRTPSLFPFWYGVHAQFCILVTS